MLMVQQTLT